MIDLKRFDPERLRLAKAVWQQRQREKHDQEILDILMEQERQRGAEAINRALLKSVTSNKQQAEQAR